MPFQQELAPAEAGGAPGVDGQDFADIEAYGVERWLAELALASLRGADNQLAARQTVVDDTPALPLTPERLRGSSAAQVARV